MLSPVWIAIAVALLALVGVFVHWQRNQRKTPVRNDDLPKEWPLMQRAIFSPEERALYRQLRTALPHHTVLAKVPLVRFCQPQDREELRYWFTLLGPIHVSFVICADNGRVLAAVDVERPNRATSKRVATIKQSVLEACRVRFVKCRSDQLPSVAELQLLVPAQGESSRPLVPAHLQDRREGRATLAHAMRSPSGLMSAPWYESGFSQDSFFAPETQRDPLADESDPLMQSQPRPGSGVRSPGWVGQPAPIRRNSELRGGGIGSPRESAREAGRDAAHDDHRHTGTGGRLGGDTADHIIGR